MKQTVLALLIGVAWWLPVHSDETRAPIIQEVITRQIEAFKADDLSGAFAFASDAIQSAFGTAEVFGHMVETGYPMVYRPGQVAFLDLREAHGTLWQKVEIRDRKGLYHLLAYDMVETDAGWKIDGVAYLGKGLGIDA